MVGIRGGGPYFLTCTSCRTLFFKKCIRTGLGFRQCNCMRGGFGGLMYTGHPPFNTLATNVYTKMSTLCCYANNTTHYCDTLSQKIKSSCYQSNQKDKCKYKILAKDVKVVTYTNKNKNKNKNTFKRYKKTKIGGMEKEYSAGQQLLRKQQYLKSDTQSPKTNLYNRKRLVLSSDTKSHNKKIKLTQEGIQKDGTQPFLKMNNTNYKNYKNYNVTTTFKKTFQNALKQKHPNCTPGNNNKKRVKGKRGQQMHATQWVHTRCGKEKTPDNKCLIVCVFDDIIIETKAKANKQKTLSSGNKGLKKIKAKNTTVKIQQTLDFTSGAHETNANNMATMVTRSAKHKAQALKESKTVSAAKKKAAVGATAIVDVSGNENANTQAILIDVENNNNNNISSGNNEKTDNNNNNVSSNNNNNSDALIVSCIDGNNNTDKLNNGALTVAVREQDNIMAMDIDTEPLAIVISNGRKRRRVIVDESSDDEPLVFTTAPKKGTPYPQKPKLDAKKQNTPSNTQPNFFTESKQRLYNICVCNVCTKAVLDDTYVDSLVPSKIRDRNEQNENASNSAAMLLAVTHTETTVARTCMQIYNNIPPLRPSQNVNTNFAICTNINKCLVLFVSHTPTHDLTVTIQRVDGGSDEKMSCAEFTTEHITSGRLISPPARINVEPTLINDDTTVAVGQANTTEDTTEDTEMLDTTVAKYNSGYEMKTEESENTQYQGRYDDMLEEPATDEPAYDYESIENQRRLNAMSPEARSMLQHSPLPVPNNPTQAKSTTSSPNISQKKKKKSTCGHCWQKNTHIYAHKTGLQVQLWKADDEYEKLEIDYEPVREKGTLDSKIICKNGASCKKNH